MKDKILNANSIFCGLFMALFGLPWWLRKTLPVMQDTLVQSLGWEDPLEKEMAIHSSILAQNPVDIGAWWDTAHGVAKSRSGLSD